METISKVEIVNSTGEKELAALRKSQNTLGARRPADILLPLSSSAEDRLLLVVPQDQGCWVSVAKNAQTAVTLQGQPFAKGVVPWGMPLGVGDLKLRFLQELLGAKSQHVHSIHPGIFVLAAIVLGASIWLGTQVVEKSTGSTNAAKPSELFDLPAPCDSTADASEGRAVELDNLAQAKTERFPFAPQDGVTAVGLFHKAEACYRLAGRDRDEQRLQQQRRNLERVLTDSYTWHRINLERALEESKPQSALLEVRALQELLKHRSDEYVQWLREVERQVALEVESL